MPAPISPETAINPDQTSHPLLDSPLHLLRRALQAYTAQWQTAVGDITPPQYAVLLTLSERPGIDQSRLGEATGIDLATLAPLVHRMEQRGLLTRRVDPGNRRRKLLALAEDGSRALERIGPLVDAVDEGVLGGLSPQERAALLHALRWVSNSEHRNR
ncbi:MarR family winged helix-turn-helix transcriptional regulator [Streptomyces sp. NPDC057579]|uniref:MarR family winged helix-turn-helix transcriptional regulator n=1 Tax=Streptomyces sp. NPDC057579 TaxID=3346172 RepID=UPI00369BB668